MSGIKVIVFDLGGTLMEYVGMPRSWAEYYEYGLQRVNSIFGCQCSPDEIKCAADVIRSYNPRINYREQEISPVTIFKDAVGHWKNISDIENAIDVFWEGIDLTVKIYDDTVAVLQELKKQGYLLATMTDIPNAMPDKMMKNDIKQLLPFFDLYVSSQSCGFRKPSPKGLNEIASHFFVSMDEIIFIGDESKDAKAAENAGCRFVKIDRSGADENAVHNLSGFVEAVNQFAGVLKQKG